MIFRICYSMFLLWLFSCHPEKQKLVASDQLRFQTTDQSEIFFKNIRRSYYDVEEIQDAGIEVYMLSRYQDISPSFIRPKISYNWRNDFAAIMLNLSDKLEKQESIVFLFENDKTSDKALFNNRDVRSQSAIAIRIYNAILNNDEIFVVIDRQKRALFVSSEEKEFFRITLFDFLRLVEIR